MGVITYLNQIEIPDFWQLALSTVVALGLVYLVEWLKQPSARIEVIEPLNHSDGRKFLKVRVKIGKGNNWLQRFFPWKNPATI